MKFPRISTKCSGSQLYTIASWHQRLADLMESEDTDDGRYHFARHDMMAYRLFKLAKDRSEAEAMFA